MSDLARVQLMQDCNWKPANQYWYELYKSSQKQIQELKKRIEELEK